MGLKDLLFDTVETGVPEGNVYTSEDFDNSLPDDTVAPEGNAIDIVQESYELNGLSDTSRSIFKVEEMLSNLPSEMPTATKKQTVQGTLGVFGLTIDELIEDATNRCNVLESVFKQISNANDSDIEQASAQIEQYKENIAELERKINGLKEETNNYNIEFNKEIERINSLVDFIGEEKKAGAGID